MGPQGQPWGIREEICPPCRESWCKEPAAVAGDLAISLPPLVLSWFLERHAKELSS